MKAALELAFSSFLLFQELRKQKEDTNRQRLYEQLRKAQVLHSCQRVSDSTLLAIIHNRRLALGILTCAHTLNKCLHNWDKRARLLANDLLIRLRIFFLMLCYIMAQSRVVICRQPNVIQWVACDQVVK